MIALRTVAVALCAIALLAPSGAQAADPNLVWYTLTTEHFHVHYHAGGEGFARRTAAVAEEARTRLKAELGWVPAESRVHIVCHDLADGANGFANVLDYDVITVLAFAPEADTDLGRYDDWLRVLVYHEMTHILHLDQADGFVQKAVNTVLGKTYLPNNALPRWFIEGIATWVESRYTPRGRVGSAQFDMYLRAAVLGKTMPTSLGGLLGDPIDRPGGSWAYLFGGSFLTYVVNHYGKDKLVDFVDRYGRYIIPYGLNNHARRAFGKDWTQLFTEYRAYLQAKVKATVAREEAAGLMEGQRLTTAGQVHHAPSFSPVGNTLVFAHTDGHETTYLYEGTVGTDGVMTSRRVFECDGGCGRTGWSADGRVLYPIIGRWADPHRFFRDLGRYELDRPTRSPAPVTRGLRAREPDIDARGRKAVVVSSTWGRTRLVEVDLRTGARRDLVGSDHGFDLNQPRWMKDGSVLFSGQKIGRWRDLYKRSPTGTITRLTRTPDREIGLALSRDERTLFYACDQGGIWNIHALDLATRERYQVTRVLGGAFNPTVSADGGWLVYSGYHAHGFDLYRLALDRARWTPLGGPESAEEEPPRYDPLPVVGRVRAYAGYRSAWPRKWTPVVQADSTGVGGVGFELIGNDSVGRHFWGLNMTYSLLREDVDITARYTYAGFRPRLNLFASRFRSFAFHYVADELVPFDRNNVFVSAGISASLPDVFEQFGVHADVDYFGTQAITKPLIRHDPGSDLPTVNDDGNLLGVSFGFSYDNVESYRYSISSEFGARLGATFRLWPTVLGNDDDTWQMTWYLDAYLPMPWWHSNVLAFKYRGGMAGGPESNRDSFSLGGFPEQDLASDLLNQVGIFGSYLRGYSSGAFRGDAYHLLTTEYRLPITELRWGPQTLPLWFNRLHGAVFSDVGLIGFGDYELEDLKATVGAELVLETEFYYSIPMTFRLGYAASVTDPFAQQFYFILGSNR